MQPGTDVDGSAQMLLRTSSGISASISLCGYSVVPIDETMLFFANGSLRLHTGSDLSVTCGIGYETVDTSSYPNAFEAQWADFISGVRAGRILYCDGHLRSVHRAHHRATLSLKGGHLCDKHFHHGKTPFFFPP